VVDDDAAVREQAFRSITDDNHELALLMIRRGLDPMSDMALPMQQLKLLLLVCAHGPQTSHQLAELLGVGAATMSGLLDRLTERELITRVPVPEDRRLRLVTATDEGQRLAHNFTSLGHRRARDVFDRMTTAELRTLADGLAAMRRAADSL
jgi:DNA-binding MarR family transcriptional regulator